MPRSLKQRGWMYWLLWDMYQSRCLWQYFWIVSWSTSYTTIKSGIHIIDLAICICTSSPKKYRSWREARWLILPLWAKWPYHENKMAVLLDAACFVFLMWCNRACHNASMVHWVPATAARMVLLRKYFTMNMQRNTNKFTLPQKQIVHTDCGWALAHFPLLLV